jgi:hypothetical protein
VLDSTETVIPPTTPCARIPKHDVDFERIQCMSKNRNPKLAVSQGISAAVLQHPSYRALIAMKQALIENKKLSICNKTTPVPNGGTSGQTSLPPFSPPNPPITPGPKAPISDDDSHRDIPAQVGRCSSPAGLQRFQRSRSPPCIPSAAMGPHYCTHVTDAAPAAMARPPSPAAPATHPHHACGIHGEQGPPAPQAEPSPAAVAADAAAAVSAAAAARPSRPAPCHGAPRAPAPPAPHRPSHRPLAAAAAAAEPAPAAAAPWPAAAARPFEPEAAMRPGGAARRAAAVAGADGPARTADSDDPFHDDWPHW